MVECPDCHGAGYFLARRSDTDQECRRCKGAGKLTTIAVVDFDDARTKYIGDEQDGVYFAVAHGGDGWYLSAVVDSNTGSFTCPLVDDDGPYESRQAADEAARDAALTWCSENDVEWKSA